MLKAYDNQHSLECHNFNDELSEGAVLEVQDMIGRQFLNTVVVADDLFAKTETTLPPNWFMAASNEADDSRTLYLSTHLLGNTKQLLRLGAKNNWAALADRPRLAPKYLPEPGLE
ncbi:hypothetical protein BY996DRAFT_6411728 [Phakopsora pachyrhizi]|nr:hypothetical protein BY996DRAFT_6411728 [Phakopsora pachyrhizi]